MNHYNGQTCDQTVESVSVSELIIHHDSVDQMIEQHVLSPAASVLRHGLVAGHQYCHLNY